MARIVDKLNPLLVAKTTKPGYYSDGNGLYLQVSATGSKSWIFRFTIKGKQREMGLGAIHTISLSSARLKAKEQRLMLVNGLDPLTVREQARAAEALTRAKMMTFDECAVETLRHRIKPGMSASVLPVQKALVETVFKTAFRRIPLDFWTLDLMALAPNHLRLLDVSAGFFVPDAADDIAQMRQVSLTIADQIGPRLSALLAQPQNWREDARKLPSVEALMQRYGA